MLHRIRPLRANRWVRRILVGLAGLYFVYVVGVWGALRSGVAEAEWEDARLEVRSGYSLWPGIFHLNDARVRFKDYNVELELGARKARVDF